MLLQNCAFVGVLLLIATQVQGFEYLEDVIARAHENLAAYKSGSDIEKPIFISEGVALDFGNLNKNTFQSLPDDLKIAIAACHKVILKGEKATYEATLAGIMQNPVLKPNTDSFINRLDKFMPEITAWWDIFGKSETVKMNELNGWFLNLITDAEFLAITQLQAGSALSMAKATQLIFKNLRGSCGPKKEGMIRRDIINMGVLQYPQAEGGHFLLHHVHLFGWVDCGNSDRNGGITGEYTKREFTARQKIITKLSDTSRGKALTFIGAVFDGVEPKPKTEKPTAPAFDYLMDDIARGRYSLALYEHGKDLGTPVFKTNGVSVDVGNLNNNTFPLLPRNLKIAIASCHQILTRHPRANHDEIVSALTQNVLLEETPGNTKMDTFIPEVTSWWNILGKSDAEKIYDMNEWFLKLIADPEYLAVTHLGNDSSSSMSMATTLIFENLRKDCAGRGKETIRRDIIDMSVLQYPEVLDGAFVVHKINLYCLVDCDNKGNKGSITDQYTRHEFQARNDIISKMRTPVLKNVLAKIEKVFSDIEAVTVEPEPTTPTPTHAGCE